MTCIVGWVEKGTVYMGGDSAGGNSSYDLHVRKDVKVFRVGEMVFGFTDSFRMGQLLHYSFTPPEHSRKKSDMDYLCTDFITAVKKCFKNNEYANVEDSVVTGGTFLLGYRGNLYRICSDFQVGKEFNNFMACGCGQSFALGALKATQSIKMTPVRRLKLAMSVAASLSMGVCAPFRVIKTL